MSDVSVASSPASLPLMYLMYLSNNTRASHNTALTVIVSSARCDQEPGIDKTPDPPVTNCHHPHTTQTRSDHVWPLIGC